MLLVTQGPWQRVGVTQRRFIPTAENRVHRGKCWEPRVGALPLTLTAGWRVPTRLGRCALPGYEDKVNLLNP